MAQAAIDDDKQKCAKAILNEAFGSIPVYLVENLYYLFESALWGDETWTKAECTRFFFLTECSLNNLLYIF
jgi:hypothetical protein